MAISSIELATRCHDRGILSKEAAEDVLHVRTKLIKQALAEKAASFTTDAVAKAKAVLPNPDAWRSAAKNIGVMVALGGALAAGGAAATGLIRHSRDKKLRGEIQSSYRQMFEEHPDLKTMDKAKVLRHFEVLTRYAPSIAGDPTVAGSWVKGTLQMKHIDADAIGKLTSTQSVIDRHNEGRALFKPGDFTAGFNIAKSVLKDHDKSH